jgi:hypothetical protein
MDHPVPGAVEAGAAKVVDDAVGLLPTGPCRGADLGPPLQRGETGGQGPDRGRIKLEAKIPPPSLILVPLFFKYSFGGIIRYDSRISFFSPFLF